MKEVVLVTGGGGFIGTNLCLRLLKEGENVVCIDNLCTGSQRNIDRMSCFSRFSFINHDVVQKLSLDFRVKEIYNLACPASPVQYQCFPIETTMTSVCGAYNMLVLAREHNCKILQASTSEVYGNPAVHPQLENYNGNVNPIGVRSCYDEGKRCAESLFFDFYRKYGVNAKVVRIFNTYGPYMSMCDGRVVPNFIMQALSGENLTVYGDGSQTRSYLYVDDLVDGMMQIMRNESSGIGPFNIGRPQEISVNKLAQLILGNVKGTKSEIVYLPLPQDDPVRRCPNISKLTEAINGWNPSTPLEEGIKKTISYFKTEVA